jgi:hypothetical protein
MNWRRETPDLLEVMLIFLPFLTVPGGDRRPAQNRCRPLFRSDMSRLAPRRQRNAANAGKRHDFDPPIVTVP